jgi:hypothetical protein
LFFWGFTSVAIAAYGAASTGPKELRFAAACLGIVCSVVWTLTNRSSKYWQKVWEEKAASASRDAVGRNIFEQPLPLDKVSLMKRIKGFPWWSNHFSVSKLAIAFSDFTALVWFGLAFKATSYGEWLPPGCAVLFAGICTGVYLIYILLKCGPDPEASS